VGLAGQQMDGKAMEGKMILSYCLRPWSSSGGHEACAGSHSGWMVRMNRV
jgi:hypothetical protein